MLAPSRRAWSACWHRARGLSTPTPTAKAIPGTRYFDLLAGGYVDLEQRPGVIVLSDIKRARGVVKANPGASLVDLGDGVLCLEFHSKMNALGEDIVQMVACALDQVGAGFEALVVANDGENFSVGANLMMVLLAAQKGDWNALDTAIRAYMQAACMAMKYAARPVVAAPFGMALGGGCELVLHAGRVQASAETYMGLVETGVGLIPAGGGCKEMLLRLGSAKRAFDLIDFAKVSESAAHARELGFLRHCDGLTMNRERLIGGCQGCGARHGGRLWSPGVPRQDIAVEGDAGYAALKMGMKLARRGRIHHGVRLRGRGEAGVRIERRTPDRHAAGLGAISAGSGARSVSQPVRQPKTQERMQYMLKNGKPVEELSWWAALACACGRSETMGTPMREAVIVDCLRTAVGKSPRGALRTHAAGRSGRRRSIRALLDRYPQAQGRRRRRRSSGCAMPEGEAGNNMARRRALRAGLPDSVSGMTINRFCSSGLQAIALAAERIRAGGADIVIAGGSESMSLMPRGGHEARAQSLVRGPLAGGLLDHGPDRGAHAAQVRHLARRCRRLRPAQPPERAARAQANGHFVDEIVPVEVRDVSPGKSRALRVRRRRRAARRHIARGAGQTEAGVPRAGTVTAGNSSQTSDGAAAALVMSETKARELGLRPMARFVSFATGGRAAGDHGHRSGGGDSQGAGAGRPQAGGHRRDRAERGVRRAGAGGDSRGRAWTSSAST